MKILIIEDEAIAAESLKLSIQSIDKDVEVLETIDSVRNAVLWFNAQQADLVFMDIHLSDGNCFSIFEQVEVSTPIIFTTAYDQYALKAFKLNSIDYLLKPIDRSELERAVAKYKEFHAKGNAPSTDLKQLFTAFTYKTEYQKRFMVYSGQKIKSIKAEEVAYFYVAEKNTFLSTFEKQSFGIEHTLDALEEMLDPDSFFRVNRQYIVNFEAIQNMFPMSKSRLKVELKPSVSDEVVVSLQRMLEFKKWIGSR